MLFLNLQDKKFSKKIPFLFIMNILYFNFWSILYKIFFFSLIFLFKCYMMVMPHKIV